MDKVHKDLGHLGCNRLQYEIFKGYYWNNITKDIPEYISKCISCNSTNLNKTIKPTNKQILSYYQRERIEMDITYLAKLYPKNKFDYNYLLYVVDHFSIFTKAYLLKSKEANEVLKNLKSYINDFGKSTMIQTDNDSEFRANIIKNYLKEQNIIFINS